MNKTGRQTDSLCTDVFFFRLMCLRLAMAHKVSQAPHSITTTTSSRELNDQRAGCQGGLGPCREPASSVSTQLLAMLLCMLPCLHFHLQGKPAREHAGRISLWLQSLYHCVQRIKLTHVSVFWLYLSATPKFQVLNRLSPELAILHHSAMLCFVYMADSDKCSLLSVVCHYVKLMSIT